MSILAEIGLEISKTMARKNITLFELSRRSKIPEQHLDQIIQAQVDVDLKTLAIIATALDARFIISRLA